MPKDNKFSLADQLFHPHKYNSRTAQFLMSMDKVIEWDTLVGIISVFDHSVTARGDRPRHSLMLMVNALFLQHFYGLSDPQLEEQFNDRLSFQHFTGLSMGHRAPDFTSFWKFKDELAKSGLTEKLFEEVNRQLDAKGLFVRKGTIVDATMIESTNRPMKGEKQQQPEAIANPQKDTDARSKKRKSPLLRIQGPYRGGYGQ